MASIKAGMTTESFTKGKTYKVASCQRDTEGKIIELTVVDDTGFYHVMTKTYMAKIEVTVIDD